MISPMMNQPWPRRGLVELCCSDWSDQIQWYFGNEATAPFQHDRKAQRTGVVVACSMQLLQLLDWIELCCFFPALVLLPRGGTRARALVSERIRVLHQPGAQLIQRFAAV